MDKMRMHTVDITDSNIERIGLLFPNCLTERIGEDGKVETAIDFDQLRQELSKEIIEGPQERYQFSWPDKKKAVRLANTPSCMTLRPCRKESVDFDNTENLYIEGDNLEVLKLLREDYLGKVKMIYIDPPYNTGDDFVYEDDFSQDASDYLGHSGQLDEVGNRLVQNTESNGRFHTDWLNMMYSRLIIAKDLLAKDGVLAISIGYQEYVNLIKLCESIFGGRQIMGVTVQTSGGKPNGAFSIVHEYVVFVCPLDFIPIPTEEDMREYASPYHGMNLATFNQVERPNQAYPIFVNKKGAIIGCGKSIQERIESGEYSGKPGDFVYDFNEAPDGCFAIWPITTKGDQCVWRLIPSRLLGDWKKGYIKVVKNPSSGTKNGFTVQYLSGGIISKIESGEVQVYKVSDDPDIPTIDVRDYKTAGFGLSTMWTDKRFYTTKGSTELKELLSEKYFPYPKPLDLVTYIIKRVTTDNDIVLDFFSGSSTTAHATLNLNYEDKGHRRFIMIQLPEKTEDGSQAFKDGYYTICDIAKERIRRAGKLILNKASSTNQEVGLFSKDDDDYGKPDVGFRVLKLDTSNMNDVYYRPEEFNEQLIKEDNVKEDRNSEDLLFQVMLECNLPLSARIQSEKIAGKEVFSVNNGYLVACFDEDVNEEVIKAVAKRKPYYFVMRDSSLASDNVADNFEQIFQAYSKETIRRIL